MGLLDNAIRGCPDEPGGTGKVVALDAEAPWPLRPNAIISGVKPGDFRLGSSAAISAWLGNICRVRRAGANADSFVATLGGGCTGSTFRGASTSVPHAMVGSAGKKLRRLLAEVLIEPSRSAFEGRLGMDEVSMMDDCPSTTGTASSGRGVTTGDSESIAPRWTGVRYG